MKEIIIDGVKYELVKKEQENFKYPIYCKSKEVEHVVKFTGLTEGTIIKRANITSYNHHSEEVGYFSNMWLKHTNTNRWEQVDIKDILEDKDAIWCWDISDTHTKCIRFWDAKNKCTFNYKGKREGRTFHNYELILPQEEPKWMKEARKTLEE